jgi:hypothetical protein
MTEQRIIDAFETRVLAFSTDPATPIKWPGINFTEPASGTQWIEFKLFPRPARSFGSDPNALTQYAGYLQATICRHSGLGIQRPANLADLLIAHMDLSTVMSSGGLDVQVTRKPSMVGMFEDAGKVKAVVRIHYSATG